MSVVTTNQPEPPLRGAPGEGAPRDGAPKDGAPRDGGPGDGAPGDGAPRDGAPQQGPPPYRLRWLVLAVVLCANVMDLIDATIVNIAGPTIRRDLGGGATTLQWLSASYTLAFAVLLVTGARLGDLFGRRRLFLAGSGGFTMTSTLCALAPSPGVLIATRALQGAFGALLVPRGSGCSRRASPRRRCRRCSGSSAPRWACRCSWRRCWPAR